MAAWTSFVTCPPRHGTCPCPQLVSCPQSTLLSAASALVPDVKASLGPALSPSFSLILSGVGGLAAPPSARGQTASVRLAPFASGTLLSGAGRRLRWCHACWGWRAAWVRLSRRHLLDIRAATSVLGANASRTCTWDSDSGLQAFFPLSNPPNPTGVYVNLPLPW